MCGNDFWSVYYIVMIKILKMVDYVEEFNSYGNNNNF